MPHAAPRRLALLATASILALGTSACGGESEKKISMKTALGSENGANEACKALIGDGTQLAKDLLWEKTDPASVKVVAGLKDDDNSFWCGIESSGGKGKTILITNSVETLNEKIQSVSYYDSETETHVTTTNTETGIGALISEVPKQANDALTKTLDGLVKRVEK